MMTSGDIEFEPNLDNLDLPDMPPELALKRNENVKIFPLTTSIVVMTAGDTALQTEIVKDVFLAIQRSIQQDETRWINVDEAVGFYVNAYNRAKAKRAQQLIFEPLGLTRET